MGKRPLNLICPVCASEWVYYKSKSGRFQCRKCGTYFEIMQTGKGIKYYNIDSPIGGPKSVIRPYGDEVTAKKQKQKSKTKGGK